jgi:dTDP-4-dehydrorhamnose 3,5-epimerase
VVITPTALPEVVLIQPDVYKDPRGFFLETYHVDKYEPAGIRDPFVQDNHSRSAEGTLRGIHLQTGPPQGKLVRVIRGAVLDVAVDLRVGSPTFGRWVTAELSEDNFHQLYIPPGFGHGFYVTRGPADVEYKCTALYAPESELGVAWNDPDLKIAWPGGDPILSNRDRALPSLSVVRDELAARNRWRTGGQEIRKD